MGDVGLYSRVEEGAPKKFLQDSKRFRFFKGKKEAYVIQKSEGSELEFKTSLSHFEA